MEQLKNHLRPFLLTLLVVPLLVLSACGSDGGGNSSGDNGDGGGKGAANYEEKITFADAKWSSIEIHNWIARTILEEGYGLKTGVKSGSSAATMLGLQRGDIQVYMEVWKLSLGDVYQRALDAGKVKQVSVNYDDDTQGLYVPEYVIKGDPDRGIKPIAPDLKKVKQLPKYKDLFADPSDPDKGRIVGSPTGWEADKTLQQKMEAYNLKESYNYFSPGSQTALVTSLAKAYKAGEPWVGYAWTPTWFAAKYNLVLLEEPKYTEECWNTDKACAFPQDEVAVAVNSDFADKAPVVMDFLSQYQTSTKITNNMLLHLENNDASPKETAKWWLKNHDLWKKWVSDDAAKKVKKALQ